MMVFKLILIAIEAYILGSVNGAILTSRVIFRRDVRNYGSGNAGLTNFLRTFGPTGLVLVLAIDVLKSVIAMLIGGWLMKSYEAVTVGRLFAGFCLMLGHDFPLFHNFKGGKAVLCGGTVAFMVDWRIGLICILGFALVVVFTGYVSLGSIIGAALCPIMMLVFDFTGLEVTLALLCALLIIFKHAENILRLVRGTERKLSFGPPNPRQRR